MSLMIQRAMQYAGYPLDNIKGQSVLSSYSDQDDLDSWAKPAAAQLIQAGLMKGENGRKLAPLNDTTHAETAVIIKRMLKALQFINQ